MRLRTVPLLAALVLVLVPAANAAAVPRPFGTHDCAPQDGVRFCPGTVANRVKTFDGVPLDADVALPATGDTGLPLVVISHGWGQSKVGFAEMRPWAERGYAVLAFSARGFGDSCGSATSRAADPAGCAKGWVHLDDVRFEARDVQQLAGLLADEGVADPQRVGVTGISYGGGVSLELAALRDRIVRQDGTLAPWTSPGGRRCGSPARCRRSRGATSCTRSSPTGARSTTRSPARGRPRAVRRREAVVGVRAVRPRRGDGVLRPARDRPRLRPDHVVRRRGRGRAGRCAGAGDRGGARGAPLAVLSRPLPRAGADAAGERLHGRPLPGRRGAAVRQPHAGAVSVDAAVDAVPRLRAHARAEQARRHGGVRAAALSVDGPLRQGRRDRDAAARGRGPDADVPGDRAVRRPVHGRDVGGAAPRRGAPAVGARADRRLGRRRPDASPPRSTRSPARARARRRAPPTSRGRRATACPPRPATATRCSAHRR